MCNHAKVWNKKTGYGKRLNIISYAEGRLLKLTFLVLNACLNGLP